jgi:phosphoribosylglycinamide formyltransferase-1
MSGIKYGFYVSNNASRLKKYLKHETINRNNISFVLIDSIGNTELCQLCEYFKIPLYQYSYSELGLKDKERNHFISNELLCLLERFKTDYCFVFGGKILIGNLLQMYKNKLINFHPSLLPAYAGLKAIDQALADNALLLGNTAHFINEELDSGKIIMQSIMPANKFSGYDSVLDLQIPMLKQIVFWLENNRIIFEGDIFYIKDAKYSLDTFIPNLEIYRT